MLIRLALISLVLAIWLVMPHSSEQTENPSSGVDVVAVKPESSEMAVKTESSPSPLNSSEKKKANKRKRLKKKRRKEKRRKLKEKRRRRRKGRKGSRKRKDRPRKKKTRNTRRRRRKKKRKNKKNKKSKKKYKKRMRTRPGRKDRLGKRPGNGGIRRGRKKRVRRPCKTDSNCKAHQCCQNQKCIRPGRGLKCFGSCMCKARKKTKNFICVTKKKKMLAHFRKYGNETEIVPRGHCRNITLTELESPSQKFVEIKTPTVDPVPPWN